MAGKGSIVSDTGKSQTNHKDEKDDSDPRFAQLYGKNEVPKKKTTFKITSVTKSSYQRGGSGGDLLSLETDLESLDDQDETIDSHTEDLSSDIFDTNSRATDIDSQDPLLTPEEIVKDSEPREKSARFRVVKVETREPFKRGRWTCCDFLDEPERPDEMNVQPSGFGGSVSLHYFHSFDEPSKNPLLAGATGTASYMQPFAGQDDMLSFAYTQGDVFRPIHPASTSHVGMIMDPASQMNSFAGQIAQPVASVPYGVPDQTLLVGSIPAGTMPVLPPMHQGETQTSQSLSGSIPFPTPDGQFQLLPIPQGSVIPSSVHSQSATMATITSTLQPQVPLQEYATGPGQVSGSQGQQIASYQQPMLYQTTQPSGYSLSNGALSSATAMGSVTNAIPSQNSIPAAVPYDGYMPDGPQLAVSGMTLSSLRSDGMLEPVPTLGAGLAQIGGGGVMPTMPTENDITEEAGTSAVAIDNKIEQAMDLVKSHLMYAVREEVEVLKEVIKELMERMHKLEQENLVLRSEATATTLARLPAPLPPLQKPVLQQLVPAALNQPSSFATS